VQRSRWRYRLDVYCVRPARVYCRRSGRRFDTRRATCEREHRVVRRRPVIARLQSPSPRPRGWSRPALISRSGKGVASAARQSRRRLIGTSLAPLSPRSSRRVASRPRALYCFARAGRSRYVVVVVVGAAASCPSDVARTVLLSSSVRPSVRPSFCFRSSTEFCPRARAGGPSSLAGRWASVSARRRRPGRGSQRARGGGRGSRLDGDAESSSVAWDAAAALIRLVVTAPAAAVVVVVVASAALLAPISSLIGQYYSGLGKWRN